MDETSQELAALQDLMDASFSAAGPHLLSIMDPSYALSAEQTVAYLQGVRHLVLATVSAAGHPFTSPVDGLFLHGRFQVTTSGSSVRARHLAHCAAVSATHLVGDDLAVVVHGTAVRVEPDDALRAVYRGIYQSVPEDWGPDIVYYRLEPRRMLTYCRDPSRFPELAAASGA